jgi:molybdopterin synthase catalytic subunit
MQLDSMLAAMKRHPRFHEAGMVLCHNGVVRATSRDGRRVSGLRVAVDHARLEEVLARGRGMPGIIDIQIRIAEGRDLAVGDDVMLLMVAGDFREHVIAALEQTLEAVKTTVTHKTEYHL